MAENTKQLYDKEGKGFYPSTYADKVGLSSLQMKDNQNNDVLTVEDALSELSRRIASVEAGTTSSSQNTVKTFIGLESRYMALNVASSESTIANIKNNSYGSWSDWSINSPLVSNQYPYLYKRYHLNYKLYYSNGSPVTSNTIDDYDDYAELVGVKGDPGVDSDDQEYIYTRTETITNPGKPTDWANVEDAVPTGWSDDPLSLVENGIEYKVVWCWWRYKTKNNDGTITYEYPSNDPIVWSKSGNDGVDGTETNTIYAGFDVILEKEDTTTLNSLVQMLNNDRSTYYSANDNLIHMPDSMSAVWSDNAGGITKKYVYIAVGTFRRASELVDGASTTKYIIEHWSNPMRITGEQGVAGMDGADFQYAFLLGTDPDNIPDVPPIGEITDTPGLNKVLNKWFDSPQGVDQINCVEFMTMCKAESKDSEGNITWGTWSAPVPWSTWGKEGLDGDGIQYVFLRINEDQNDWIKENGWNWTNPGNNSYHTVSTSGIQNDSGQDYVEDGISSESYPYSSINNQTYTWQDDPLGVSENYPYEYAMVRKFKLNSTLNKKVWSEWSAPKIWAHFGLDANGYTLVLENPTDVVYYTSGTIIIDDDGITTGAILVPGEDPQLANLSVEHSTSSTTTWVPFISNSAQKLQKIICNNNNWLAELELQSEVRLTKTYYSIKVNKLTLTNAAFEEKSITYQLTNESGTTETVTTTKKVLKNNICKIGIRASSIQHPAKMHTTYFNLVAMQDLNGDGVWRYMVQSNTTQISQKITGQGVYNEDGTITYTETLKTTLMGNADNKIILTVKEDSATTVPHTLPNTKKCVVVGTTLAAETIYDSGEISGGLITINTIDVDKVCEAGGIKFDIYVKDPDYQVNTQCPLHSGFYFADSVTVAGMILDLRNIAGLPGERGEPGLSGAYYNLVFDNNNAGIPAVTSGHKIYTILSFLEKTTPITMGRSISINNVLVNVPSYGYAATTARVQESTSTLPLVDVSITANSTNSYDVVFTFTGTLEDEIRLPLKLYYEDEEYTTTFRVYKIADTVIENNTIKFTGQAYRCRDWNTLTDGTWFYTNDNYEASTADLASAPTSEVEDIVVNGLTGKMPRFYDIVYYGNADATTGIRKMYRCKKHHAKSSSINPTNTTYWTEATGYDFLQANNAYISQLAADNVQAHKILVTDASGNIKAGMLDGTASLGTGYSTATDAGSEIRIFAGLTDKTLKNAAFYVTEDGTVHMTKGSIGSGVTGAGGGGGLTEEQVQALINNATSFNAVKDTLETAVYLVPLQLSVQGNILAELLTISKTDANTDEIQDAAWFKFEEVETSTSSGLGTVVSPVLYWNSGGTTYHLDFSTIIKSSTNTGSGATQRNILLVSSSEFKTTTIYQSKSNNLLYGSLSDLDNNRPLTTTYYKTVSVSSVLTSGDTPSVILAPIDSDVESDGTGGTITHVVPYETIKIARVNSGNSGIEHSTTYYVYYMAGIKYYLECKIVNGVDNGANGTYYGYDHSAKKFVNLSSNTTTLQRNYLMLFDYNSFLNSYNYFSSGSRAPMVSESGQYSKTFSFANSFSTATAMSLSDLYYVSVQYSNVTLSSGGNALD